MYRVLLFILFLVIAIPSEAKTSEVLSAIEQNTYKIEQLFQRDEDIGFDKPSIELAYNLIKNRSYYSNNTIAKAFIVLTNVAYNKGDRAGAFQFATDGLTLTGISIDLKLNLLLKITKGHYKEARFENVLENAEKILKLAYGIDQIQTRIIALSYKAMALSSLGDSKKASTILNKIELLIKDNQFSEHISALEILADAYLFQRDYQTAITLYNKVVMLRFDYSQFTNLGQTYLNLAKAYQRSNKLDDAYNAYWESQVHAKKYNLAIRASLAQLGLGQLLLEQGKFEKSYATLLDAYAVLSSEDLNSSYLETLISLAVVARELKKYNESERWLILARDVAEGYSLSLEQIKLFELLARMYNEKSQYKRAYTEQKKYTEHYKKFHNLIQKQIESIKVSNVSVTNNRELVVKLSNESDQNFNYEDKFKRQDIIIFLLSALLIILLIIYCIWSIKRTKIINEYGYLTSEFDYGSLASPEQTKQLYQFTFKMARKYQYPLTISYIVIENWDELVFRFNKKTVKEVHKTISTLISESIGEFDRAGKINDGEYILMCPHQKNDAIQVKMEQLVEAFKVRFFANIGDFAIKIKYTCDMPTIQDIDPYLFLSHLSENNLEKTQKK